MPVDANRNSLPDSILCASGNDVVYDFSVDVRQTKVAATIAVGELFVVEPHEVQDGGVQVVYVYGILDGGAAELVCGTVGEAGFYTTTGHPDGESVVIMIAAFLTLGSRRSPELAAPDDKCFIE